MKKENTFLWGVATSAFQLEGSPYADWTTWDSIPSSNPSVTNDYILRMQNIAGSITHAVFWFKTI
jgi:beta-glucosidase